jgi:hypothetical protein
LIGLHGKKYLSLLNGANKATPSPPFLSMSSSVYERIDGNRKRKTGHLPPAASRNRTKVSSAPSAAAIRILPQHYRFARDVQPRIGGSVVRDGRRGLL